MDNEKKNFDNSRKNFSPEEIDIFKKFEEGDHGIIARSQAMLEVFLEILAYSSTKNILVSGETGTGKELVARGLHRFSRRGDKQLVVVNCGAIPKNNVETTLFGHKKGSFTGAEKDADGYFQAANEGNIFLDEIGELPIESQAQLLRVAEYGDVQRLGLTVGETVDVRIISATNRILTEEISKGNFREDLYYRLSDCHIKLPPLNHRENDIPLLCYYFFRKFIEEHGEGTNFDQIDTLKMITAQFFNPLKSVNWKSNVRGIMKFVKRLVLKNQGYLHYLRPLMLVKLHQNENLTIKSLLADHTNSNTFEIPRYFDIFAKYVELGCNARQTSKSLNIDESTTNRKINSCLLIIYDEAEFNIENLISLLKEYGIINDLNTDQMLMEISSRLTYLASKVENPPSKPVYDPDLEQIAERVKELHK